MAVFETWLKNDLQKPVKVEQLTGNLFSADNSGNLIGVEVLDGGQAASLSGNVYGYIIRADESTVIVQGTLSGNRASIVLPGSAYAVIGHISIVIKVGATTVGACVSYVYRTTTDAIIDPADVIPSIAELLEKIGDCEAATTAANTAATNANTKAALANEKAGLANTAAENADAKAALANTAAGAANAAAVKINDMTVAASGLAEGASPTATITEVSGHKHIAFGIPRGNTGATGPKGKDFRIRKTFVSIAAMEAYDPDQDQSASKVTAYDFVMIDTGSVQDVDTGKLFCYEPEESTVWHYIGDLSGSQGIKGETGTGIASIVLNQDYTLTITMDDGTTSYTTASIRGATGATGATGNGISSITLNSNFTLTIEYTDGTSTTTASIRGATGNGIASVVLNQDYTLTITFTDGNSYTTGSIRGLTGVTPDISIGTVVTLQPNESAYVTLDASSTPEAPVLNIGIPQGRTGTMENTYATTIPMSVQDSTTIYEELGTKADKDSDAVSGNFAAFDSNGNPVDSGHKHADYLTQHQDISGKADKENPVFTGSISMGRKSNTTIGTRSVAEGTGVTASGSYSHAEGESTTASGKSSHVSGRYNVGDSINNLPSFESNTSYVVGDIVRYSSYVYVCKEDHTSGQNFEITKWIQSNGLQKYIEIIGNGVNDDLRSNARALDWHGNEYLNGDLFIKCDADSTNGTSVGDALEEMAGQIGTVPSGTDLQSQVTSLNNNVTNLSNSIGTVPSGNTVEGQISALNNKISNTSYTSYANFFESNGNGFSSGVVTSSATDSPFSSGSTDAIQFKYSSTFGVQFSMRPQVNAIYYRRISSGTWTSWSEIYSSTPKEVTVSATIQNITIPAGTPSSPQTVTIDLSSYRPSSSHNLMNVLICMQDNNAGEYYNLPNLTHDATKYTVVSVVGTTNIKIENTQSTWGTTKACITMFWQK